jgi:hypothetical protein
VTALTAVALAVIGFFAYQADAAQDRDPVRPDRAADTGADAQKQREKLERETNLPAFSGVGRRVVYDLDRDRVWLMGENQEVERTFRVAPSSVDPTPGTYKVESRAPHVTGTDGVPVENVVRFATSQGTTIGFSAALDGSMPKADPREQTGGIRERRADGKAMWLFAKLGMTVVVVR